MVLTSKPKNKRGTVEVSQASQPRFLNAILHSQTVGEMQDGDNAAQLPDGLTLPPYIYLLPQIKITIATRGFCIIYISSCS